jgi:hypothetical protein
MTSLQLKHRIGNIIYYEYHSFFVDSFSVKEVRMTPDESYAVLLLAFLLVTVTQKKFAQLFLELLLKITRPGATVLLMSLLVFVYHKGLHYTFLVLALLVVFILKDVWSQWISSDARRLLLETGRDQDRFDHSSSIDIQMADGTVKHSPPPTYTSRALSSLLVFPPSEQTLKEMNG